MCNCIEESVKKTTEHLTGLVNKHRNEIYELESSDYENKAFTFGEKTDLLIAMPFEFVYVRRKVNGMKENKFTTMKVSILPTYCPFCGIKINKS
jgi:hypothetical protein